MLTQVRPAPAVVDADAARAVTTHQPKAYSDDGEAALGCVLHALDLRIVRGPGENPDAFVSAAAANASEETPTP